MPHSVKPQSASSLAIAGGAPVRTAPLPPWPHFAPEDVEAAAAVLRSGKVNYWTGEQGRAFEREFAEFVGCRHAVALANGSVALEAALYALGIGPGDQVVVPSRTFIASASCAVMRGATPVMADVDRDSGTLTAATARAALTPRTRALIAVHLGGRPCDMDPILALARERGLKVIEDCAQSLGASYKGRPTGSLGDIAAFSFCQDKIMTTGGEGGMVTCNDPVAADKVWSLKDHGKSFDACYNRQHPPGFRWLHESFGTNWRMTEMQSALGRAVLPKVPEFLRLRRRNAQVLFDAFRSIPALRVPAPGVDVAHAFYRFYAYVEPDRLAAGWDRDRIMDAVNAEGIFCQSGSCSEIYLEKAFPAEMRPAERLPVARELGETSLMFLVHPTLSERDMADTARAVEKVMAVAASP
ncbi:MAG TPA: DegT/DnrJ/EryC1/StrS aminotransferase family protein [Terriglobales bacterium]|nr:DegT/DnrJ/EryC1/StrS aminotransferase family protein [Terriglobales bacterium]